MRRWLLAGCALSAALIAAAQFSHRTSPAEAVRQEGTAALAASRPNVIICLVDTLRADHLGVYGYHRDTSPLLDRWASGGVVFDRAYSPSSWTKPSTVSLLSGLDPISHRVEDRLDAIPADVRFLSEHLRSNGYATFAAVTNPNVLPVWGFDRGFDVYEDLDASGRGTRADSVADHVSGRMAEFARRQPFFLYLHLIDPHPPYDPPPPFDTRFPRSPALPPKQSIGRYDGEIAFVDSQFGRLLASLRENGLEEKTMIIFVADHGEELLDHGSIGHGINLFEEVVRIPLIVRFPKGAHAGTRVAARVSLIDVLPTVMSVLGQPPPAGVDGRDLTVLLDDHGYRWAKRELFLSLNLTGNPGRLLRGVLSGPRKYLRSSRPRASEALFNLEEDPAETENLANLQADSRARMAAMLDAYLARRSSGVHLRIVNDLAPRPVGCQAVLRTTGRFIDVSKIQLEAVDRFDLSDDGHTLRLDCRLENRTDPTDGAPRRPADEDGLLFRVTPPTAPIVVEHLGLTDDRALPLEVGAHRGVEAVPFTFDATAAAWSVRDFGEVLRGSWPPTKRAAVGAYLAVVTPAARRERVSQELHDRLRALGYLGDPTESG